MQSQVLGGDRNDFSQWDPFRGVEWADGNETWAQPQLGNEWDASAGADRSMDEAGWNNFVEVDDEGGFWGA